MKWDAELEFAPVRLEDGRELVTLDDARRYLAALPRTADDDVLWKNAALAVWRAAERPDQFWLHVARSSLSRAILGETPLRSPPRPKKRDLWRERRRARRQK